MTEKKLPLSRRDAFKISAGVGLGLSVGRMPEIAGNPLQRIFANALPGAFTRALGGEALAQGSGPKRCLVHIVIIDKTQTSLFQHIGAGTPPPGLDAGGGLAQQAVDFRRMSLTKLFGDPLAELPANVSFAMSTAWNSGSGGHSLVNSYVDDELGGMNSAFEQLSGGTGILGAVGFNMNASANESREAFMGPGMRQLTTFETVKDLGDTLESSVTPLKDAKSLEMVRFMDSLVTPKFEMRDRLVGLANTIGAAVPELRAAQALTWTNSMMPATGNNNMMQAMPDGIMQQVRAVIALYKAGVARNFMIGIPWNDTNGGNSLTNAGGELRLDPFSATPKIAAAIVELHKAIPDLVCVTTSDGGRSPNNGDQAAGLGFLTGPDSVVNNGLLGDAYTSFDQLNQTRGQVTFSDNSKGVATPGDWYRTALVALGVMPKAGRYVKQALKG